MERVEVFDNFSLDFHEETQWNISLSQEYNHAVNNDPLVDLDLFREEIINLKHMFECKPNYDWANKEL